IGGPVSGLATESSHRRQVDAMRRKDRETNQRRNESIEREWTRHSMAMQNFLVKFTCAALGLACGATFVLFFVDGFRPAGFQFEAGLMHWIGAATIGVLAGLASCVYRAFFGRR